MQQDTQTPDESILNEALAPDLSDETFTLCGQTYQIKPLTLLNEMRLYKRLKDLGKDLAQALAGGDMAILDKLEEHHEIIFEVVIAMCENDDKPLTKEQLLNQREVGLKALLTLVVRYCQKMETLRPAIDFFTKELWPRAKEVLKLKAKDQLERLEEEIRFLSELTSTNSLNSSSTDTEDGQLETPSD